LNPRPAADPIKYTPEDIHILGGSILKII